MFKHKNKRLCLFLFWQLFLSLKTIFLKIIPFDVLILKLLPSFLKFFLKIPTVRLYRCFAILILIPLNFSIYFCYVFFEVLHKIKAFYKTHPTIKFAIKKTNTAPVEKKLFSVWHLFVLSTSFRLKIFLLIV